MKAGDIFDLYKAHSKDGEHYGPLIKMIRSMADSNIPNINTRLKLYGGIRADVKARFGYGTPQMLALKQLALDPEERKGIAATELKRVTAANENVKIFTKSDVEKLRTAIGTLNNEFDKAVLRTMLATGGRLIEVLSDEFKISKSPMEGHIVQSSGAKSKNPQPITKPLVTESYEKLNADLSVIRKNILIYDSDTNETISNRYSARINYALTRLRVPNIDRSHDLRRLYAAIAYKLHGRATSSEAVYYARILGHVDTQSALYYSTFRYKKKD